jgi:hypothetical protein
MWWPDSWGQSINDLVRYDYIGWGPWDNEDTLLKLKQMNPNQLHFMSINLTEVKWDEWQNKDSMSQIPAEWFLTQMGSELTDDIDSKQTKILVKTTKDPYGNPLFKKNDTIVCGFESMKVHAVNHQKSTLFVERGFVRTAENHTAGERVAAHITFWPETWVMNMSTLCPLYDTGQGLEQWIEWALRNDMHSTTMDGLILDRLENTQSWLIGRYARTIDPDCSNTLMDDGYEEFDMAWDESIKSLLSLLRDANSGKPIIANSSGSYKEHLNGMIFESCPGNWSDSIPETYRDWAKSVLGADGYIAVSREGYRPDFSLIETYEIEEYSEENPMDDPSFIPNYKRMRWGLTTALLGDGYFSYEIGINGHGSSGLMWFDEYDNAGRGRGYLGYPTSDAYVVRDYGRDRKVFRRDYQKGIVLCNPSEREATVNLQGTYRLIKGVQQPGINTGKLVTSIRIDPRDGRILLNGDKVALR